ncbi:MAG: hypothetical protein APG12_00638 [Candidatus Methanofastidiosum methylothiophilum]|uniref:Uncharacterized protein n=1 Tax=Candidatus Methanofastidiosum methylothiophilum TaxID=1705564 RepID=A0A150IL96_9EURY|nr:MAG: hypothetical protein APG10_00587 [Candidatus Methanofastidiosum methylthiophilus]KYC48036.1 MAG: hypothetical protein APG11_00706 [Candidatus Methanofastidiosum methylthiophilus]KYC50726.1 MAG: hypothetical protein APG12_00638 [Candidatus Methanofastidiosum methylthiophilus]
MEFENNRQLKNSMLTKLSGLLLIFFIIAILNLISILVSYFFFHKIIGFLNKNFILLTFLLMTIFIGSILKEINSRLKYVSPLFYALGGLSILILTINAIIDLDFALGGEYIKIFQNKITFSYSLAFITVLLIGYFVIFTGMTQSEITGSVCKYNMFSFCLFMDAVMFIERIFWKINGFILKIFSDFGNMFLKK